MEQDKRRSTAIERIAKQKKKSMEDAKEIYNGMVQEKIKSLGGLITTEGAEELVLNDLGIAKRALSIEPRDSTIGSLTPGTFNVNVIARIVSLGPIREFTKKSGQQGMVCNATIADGTGVMILPLWDENATLVKSGRIKENTVVQVEGGYTKEQDYGKYDVQLCLSKKGRLVIDPSGVNTDSLPQTESKEVKIADLPNHIDDAFTVVTVVARITKLFRKEPKATRTGGKYIGGFCRDATGSASFSLWGDTTELVTKGVIAEGKVIRFTKPNIRAAWADNTVADISANERTLFEEISDVSEEDYPTAPETIPAKRKTLVEAFEGEKIEFVGSVTSVRSDFVTKSLWRMTCPQPDCYKGVSAKKESDSYECPAHGEVKDYDARATIGGRVSDGTMELPFRSYDKSAEKLIALDIEHILKDSETAGNEPFLKRIEQQLVGLLFVLQGTVSTSDWTGKLSITINSVSDISLDDEVSHTLRAIHAQLQVQGK